jgi:hypothetical protein
LNHKAKALRDLRNSSLIDHWRNLVESWCSCARWIVVCH